MKILNSSASIQRISLIDVEDHPNFVVGVTHEETDEIVTLVFRTKQGVFRLTADSIELISNNFSVLPYDYNDECAPEDRLTS